MVETYITLKTAQFAEEVGFNEFCDRFFDSENSPKDNKEFLYSCTETCNSSLTRSQYSALTQSQLADWLRERHDIDVLPTISYNSEHKRVYTYDLFHKSKHIDSIGFEEGRIKYEDTYELGLFRALTFLKSK